MSQATQGTSVMVTGRIVFLVGDLFAGEPAIDDRTNQRKVSKDGEPMTNYGFGLAVPKSELGKLSNPVNFEQDPGAIWYAIHAEAQKLFPPPAQVPPGDKFAWKYKDGDGIDHMGMPFADRDGYAGHIIFALTTTIAPKFFTWRNGQNELTNEGIKCGDYVRVQVSVKGHHGIGQGKPGLYLNPNAVQFLGYGTAIESRVSGNTIFGMGAPALPPGATAMPTAPAGSGMLLPSAAPQGFAPPPGVQGPAQNFAPPAAAPQVQPHYQVLPQAVQPMMPPAPMAPQVGQHPGYAPPIQAQPPAPQQFPQIPGMTFPQPQ